MLNKSNRNKKKKKKLASCTLNTVKDNILTELSIDHFADKYHLWLVEGIIQLTWKF